MRNKKIIKTVKELCKCRDKEVLFEREFIEVGADNALGIIDIMPSHYKRCLADDCEIFDCTLNEEWPSGVTSKSKLCVG